MSTPQASSSGNRPTKPIHLRIELLTVGTELLSGATLNTNVVFLGRRLTDLGLHAGRHVSIPDRPSDIIRAIRESAARSDVVVLTGGLGPTFDDLTMAGIAAALRLPLAIQPDAVRHIRAFYQAHGRRVSRPALRQARLPRGAVALPNAHGTAAGMWLEHRGVIFVALPGVPREMTTMWEQHVEPRLRQLPRTAKRASALLRTAGLRELEIERRLKRLRLPTALECGLYPNLRMVDVRLSVSDSRRGVRADALASCLERIRRSLGTAVYAHDEQSLAQVLGTRLVQRGLTLSVAESCTGGLVCRLLTDVPGSSRYFRGGVIAYDNSVKHALVGVPDAILARDGAVSAAAAKALAQGVRRRTGTSLGLSVTGIAGPSGGSKDKPVGLVHFGLADATGALSTSCRFVGDRASIREQAAQTALDWLRRWLRNRSTKRGARIPTR